jgi:cysteine desulfurase/selenocysteine lyase
MYGPTGIGVLYGKREILKKMEPPFGGGGMIRDVDFYESTFLEESGKFEAGTPAFSEAIVLGEAIRYLEEIGMDKVFSFEKKLLSYFEKGLKKIDKVKIIGNAKEKAAISSFVVEVVSSYDVGAFLDTKNIAIRTGGHCVHPTLKKLDISGASRVSFGIYNGFFDIDVFLKELKRFLKIVLN